MTGIIADTLSENGKTQRKGAGSQDELLRIPDWLLSRHACLLPTSPNQNYFENRALAIFIT